MKKFKSILALLLALVVMFTFFGCAEQEDDDKKSDKESTSQNSDKNDDDKDREEEKEEDTGIVGEWEGTVDLSVIYNPLFEQMLGEDLAKYLELDSFDVRVTFNFEEDGEYDLVFNKRDFEDALEDASKIWVDGYYDIIELAIEDAGLDMTADEYAQEALGCTIEEYVSSVMVVDTSSLEQSGNYELDGNKLYVDEEDEYYIIALDGDELEFKEYRGTTEMESELEAALLDNVIFERQ